jgi:anti-anti-sigma regulatory factor
VLWAGFPYDDGVLAISDTDSPPGLILSGEIDEVEYPALVRALERFTDSTEVHLDLSGLHYCDVSCLRAMVLLASPDSGDQVGRQVVLHKVPTYLATTLRILGWDRIPGLSVCGAADTDGADPRDGEGVA